jgi:hypothetical protein
VSAIERLIDILAGRIPLGIASPEGAVALVMPALIVCIADWQLRARTKAIEQDEERVRRLPAPAGGDLHALTCTPATPPSRSPCDDASRAFQFCLLVIAAFGPDWLELLLMLPEKREGMAVFTHSVPAVLIGGLLARELYSAPVAPGAGRSSSLWCSTGGRSVHRSEAARCQRAV